MKLFGQRRVYSERDKENCRKNARLYYQRHPDRVKAAHQRKLADDPDYSNRKMREWLLRNREHAKAMRKAWCLANPEKVKDMVRRSRAKHPEPVKAAHNRKRVKRRAAPGSHTIAEWRAILDKAKGRCAGFNQKTHHVGRDKLTRDHIVPLSRGGTDYAFNIQPMCHACNSQKRTTLTAEAQHSLFDRLAVHA